MIDVRIRNAADTHAVPLCRWPATDLDRILPTLGAWGIHSGGNTYNTPDLVAQIHVDDVESFFEIIVGNGY